ncbi:MAG: MFS transporter, partial [Beutenbergiaceae bacterium]
MRSHAEMEQAATAKERLPRQIWVLVGAAFVIALGYGIIAPVLPRFAASFGVSTTAAAAVVSAFALTRLLGAPLGGTLTARLGERRIYLVGVFIVAISTGAVSLASSYVELLLYRGIGGLGSVMFTVSATTLVVRVAPAPARGAAAAAMGSAFLLGNVAGPMVGTALSGLGMRLPFLIYMTTLLLACLIVALLLREPARTDRTTAAPPAPLSVRQAWSDGVFRAVMVSGFLNGWANFGIRMAVIPLFAVTLAGAGQWAAGGALTAFAVGNAITLVIAGRSTDARGRRIPMFTGLLVAGVTTAVAGYSGNVWWLLVLCVVAGMGTGVYTPAQQAALADVVGNERSGAPVVAAVGMATDIGAILGPLVAGLIVDGAGYGLAFAV